MAAGKKSFKLYVDYLDDFEELSNDELGKVMRWVFEYTNDLEPDFPEERELRGLCKRIKRDLKRHLEAYLQVCKQNKANASKRWESGTKDSDRMRPHAKNADKDKDKDKDKDIYIQPTLDEFIQYAKSIEIYRPELEFETRSKYDTWKQDGWVDGNGSKIKNWKTKLRNTMPHFKGVKVEMKKVTW